LSLHGLQSGNSGILSCLAGFSDIVIIVPQAQARCHRIGQLRAVKVYRLITSNTYEREMFDKASLKLGLDKAVLQSMGNKELSMVCAALLLLKQQNAYWN